MKKNFRALFLTVVLLITLLLPTSLSVAGTNYSASLGITWSSGLMGGTSRLSAIRLNTVKVDVYFNGTQFLYTEQITNDEMKATKNFKLPSWKSGDSVTLKMSNIDSFIDSVAGNKVVNGAVTVDIKQGSGEVPGVEGILKVQAKPVILIGVVSFPELKPVEGAKVTLKDTVNAGGINSTALTNANGVAVFSNVTVPESYTKDPKRFKMSIYTEKTVGGVKTVSDIQPEMNYPGTTKNGSPFSSVYVLPFGGEDIGTPDEKGKENLIVNLGLEKPTLVVNGKVTASVSKAGKLIDEKTFAVREEACMLTGLKRDEEYTLTVTSDTLNIENSTRTFQYTGGMQIELVTDYKYKVEVTKKVNGMAVPFSGYFETLVDTYTGVSSILIGADSNTILTFIDTDDGKRYTMQLNPSKTQAKTSWVLGDGAEADVVAIGEITRSPDDSGIDYVPDTTTAEIDYNNSDNIIPQLDISTGGTVSGTDSAKGKLSTGDLIFGTVLVLLLVGGIWFVAIRPRSKHEDLKDVETEEDDTLVEGDNAETEEDSEGSTGDFSPEDTIHLDDSAKDVPVEPEDE